MLIDQEIEYAASLIKNGKLVAFPTETVYGLGADALNPIAVAKIFELKERPTFDPLIVHIANLKELERLTLNNNQLVYKLAEMFWPGPLTIVLPKSKMVPDIVSSGLSTVAIRMPNNPIALQLIEKSNCPIAAPSANKFGCLSPVSATHVKKQLPHVDYIIDGGVASVGLESTIVLIEDNVCQILRHGYITQEDIECKLPNVFVFKQNESNMVVAPGLLKSHYSPKKPLYLLKHRKEVLPQNSAVILHGYQPEFVGCEKIIFTSSTYNKIEIAANLFSTLHLCEDDVLVEQIFIEQVEAKGLGIAIMDRIRKAAYRYSVV